MTTSSTNGRGERGTARGPRVEFRSADDLERSILGSMSRFPRDIDLVVGIPRSGMLAASLFALHRHTRLTDFDTFLEGRITGHGERLGERPSDGLDGIGKILVLDDSVASGGAMKKARARLAESSLPADVVARTSFGAVFASDAGVEHIDHYCEVVPSPRMFSWNLMGSGLLAEACVDIDGVLCVDPTDVENDDGPRYIEFLENAIPLLQPAGTIGHLVTSRLEKYRPQTEAWLAAHGVDYGELHMIDLPTAKERRQQGAHAPFKASVYQATNAPIFIESDPVQAQVIANTVRRPAICVSTMDHAPSVECARAEGQGPCLAMAALSAPLPSMDPSRSPQRSVPRQRFDKRLTPLSKPQAVGRAMQDRLCRRGIASVDRRPRRARRVGRSRGRGLGGGPSPTSVGPRRRDREAERSWPPAPARCHRTHPC